MEQSLKSLQAKELPTSPAALLAVLDNLGIAYKLHNHPPIFTVAEGLHLKESIPGLHCRNLFLRDKKEIMYLVVVANDTKVDLKNLEKLLGSARLSFGSPERLWTHLGITPGSVCPFAAINDREHKVTVILDAYMMKAETVCYHPLDNAQTIGLSPDDLLRFFAHTGHSPKILDLSALSPT
ncbi:MAG TPA: prolyl-tRNA synthetase associated domain-containing protein [Alphaproteobacteria bacterium]|jgi:Ala-tRNA(Pro) deacylase|nr:prolyl-tRNA synthetase associated domain-containing protein [Micavibrio sp.]MBK9562145.1 prolyl-tRNA synthetase associated domain-containing protein [Micavibrio sp.]HQX28191.1 prolyl-tRNA synthetase associated domain-containing protein [Alphaproteobacteria bacterium]